MVELREIVEDLLKDVEAAKKDVETAKGLIAIGEEVGIDVTKEKADLTRLIEMIGRFEVSLKKRLE